MNAQAGISGTLLGAFTAVLLGMPARGHACSIAQTPHVVVPAMQATDHQPPTLAPIVHVQITRGQGSGDNGCSSIGSSCDDLGRVTFLVAATDDMTPAAQIGYGFSLTGGALPQGFVLPATALRAQADGSLTLVWEDGATDAQEALDFTLRLVAIDLAGNESEPQMIRIQQGSAGGCRLGGPVHNNGDATILFAGIALLALMGPRRRRRDRRGG
jgi:hypothetical protein